MDVTKLKQLSAVAAMVFSLSMLFAQCTMDKVTRPAPRIDLLYSGSEPSSDTLTFVFESTVRFSVRMFAVAGIKAVDITENDSARTDYVVNAKEDILTCDSAQVAVSLSGSTAYSKVLAFSVTDWQDQKTEKSIVLVYTPGGQVVTKPNFYTSPTSTTVGVGDTATFSAFAMGGNLRYQWQKNAVDIPNANANSYTTPPVVNGDNGSTFRCIISNSAGRDTSLAATLTVFIVVAPTITTDPQSKSVTVGETATFTAYASGTSPTYQWQKNDTNIIDAVDNSYTTPITVIADNGAKFRCIASNNLGRDTSAIATLTVTPVVKPTITVDPASDSIGVGERATFFVRTTGSRATYAWQKNGVTITGAKDSTYTTTSLAVIGDNGSTFRCIATNSAGSDTSTAATLAVSRIPPKITSQPQNTAVNSGGTAYFWVGASGSDTLTYQWQKNSVNINGATSTQYSTSATDGDNGAIFRCIVSNSAGKDTSDVATLTVAVLEKPIVTIDPVGVTVTAPATAYFAVTATGTSPNYQWQKNGANITGAQYRTYTTPATAITDSGATFRCIVTNGAGGDTSAAAILIVNRPPIATIGQSYGGGIVFYIDATGQHGLVAATSDQSAGAEWGCDATSIAGTSAVTGTGQANTTLIVNGCSTAGTAARICDDLTSGIYSDWYLPSKAELALLYAQKSNVGGLSGTMYWSSTENNSTTASFQIFSGGAQVNASKTTPCSVRAIRAF